jgi:hypothetical protein
MASLLNLVIPTWPLAKTPRNDLFPELQEDFDTDLWCARHARALWRDAGVRTESID